MAMRHRLRHVQQTIADHVEQGLIELGWVEPPINFGASPVRFQDVEPDAARRLEGNVVGVVIEDEGPVSEFELGGGVEQVDYDLGVSVYAESSGIAMALADDIKDLVSNRVIPLLDYTQQPPTPVPGHHIELVDVRVQRRTAGEIGFESKRSWRVLDGVARLYSTES
jgi:hypothetical protein